MGEAFIPAGEISAGKTRAMNVTLTISADGFLGNSVHIYRTEVAGLVSYFHLRV